VSTDVSEHVPSQVAAPLPSPFHPAGITDPTQPYGNSKHNLPAIRKVCVHLTYIMAERILLILHF